VTHFPGMVCFSEHCKCQGLYISFNYVLTRGLLSPLPMYVSCDACNTDDRVDSNSNGC